MESTTKDFNTLVEAKEKITEIATMAVDRSSKLLNIKATDVLPQIAEYLQKVLQLHFKEDFSKSGFLMEINMSGYSEYGGGVRFKRLCDAEQNKGNRFYLNAFTYGNNVYIVFTDDGFYINSSLGDALHRCNSNYPSSPVGALIPLWENLKDSIDKNIEHHYRYLIERAQAEVNKQLAKESIFNGFKL